MFDYDSASYFENNLDVSGRGKIYLQDKTLRFVRENDPILLDYIYMNTIKPTNGKYINYIIDNYFLYFDNLEELNSKQGAIISLQDRIWLVLRHSYFDDNVIVFNI